MMKTKKVFSVLIIGAFAIAILSSCHARRDRCPTDFGKVEHFGQNQK